MNNLNNIIDIYRNNQNEFHIKLKRRKLNKKQKYIRRVNKLLFSPSELHIKYYNQTKSTGFACEDINQ